MTEKRFSDVWCSETGQIGLTDNGIDKTFTSSEFVDWLNELNCQLESNSQDDYIEHLKQENEQLKSELGNCRECLDLNRSSCARHMRENEELKSEITTLKGGYDEYEEIVGELKQENKQLKEEVETLQEVIAHFNMDGDDGL